MWLCICSLCSNRSNLGPLQAEGQRIPIRSVPGIDEVAQRVIEWVLEWVENVEPGTELPRAWPTGLVAGMVAELEHRQLPAHELPDLEAEIRPILANCLEKLPRRSVRGRGS